MVQWAPPGIQCALVVVVGSLYGGKAGPVGYDPGRPETRSERGEEPRAKASGPNGKGYDSRKHACECMQNQSTEANEIRHGQGGKPLAALQPSGSSKGGPEGEDGRFKTGPNKRAHKAKARKQKKIRHGQAEKPLRGAGGEGGRPELKRAQKNAQHATNAAQKSNKTTAACKG